MLAAEERNFARAAARANLSQTPFGRSIHALEARLGVRLFDRTTRSVTLTAIGRQVLAQVRTLLAQARQFDGEVRELAGAESGEITFGASHFAVDCFLRGIVPALRAKSPKVGVRISINPWDELVAQLDAEETEFFVAFPGGLGERDEYRLTMLSAQPASLFCRTDHPLLQGRGGPTGEALLDYPWGALEFSNTTVTTIMTALRLAPGRSLPMMLDCASKELLLESMLTSDMLVGTWRHWLEEPIRAGRVVDLGARLRPRLAAEVSVARCAIVERADRSLSPLARNVKALILAGPSAGSLTGRSTARR